MKINPRTEDSTYYTVYPKLPASVEWAISQGYWNRQLSLLADQAIAQADLYRELEFLREER